MSTIKWLCCAVWVGLIVSQPAFAAPFTQAVIFGDSLSDTGNAYNELGSGAMQDPENYFNGRFSNGPLWVEYLADQLTLSAPVANTIDTVNGRNYAFGGAWTSAGVFDIIHWVINDINEQVPDFISDGGPTGDELIILWGGANDLKDGQTNTASLVSNLADDITSLYNAGGRHFMVVNLPLLGQTPRFKNTPDETNLDNLSNQFNTQLDSSLNNLESSLTGIDFYRINASFLITDAIANPATYELTNTSDQAKGLAGIDPDTYLFWDDIHPTTAGHRLLAQNAASVLFNALSIIPGDLDFDGFVGIEDLNTVLSNWNTNVSPGNPLFGDPTNDGFVGIEDLNLVLGNWNAGTPPNDVGAVIPEPGTGLAGLVILLCSTNRRRL